MTPLLEGLHEVLRRHVRERLPEIVPDLARLGRLLAEEKRQQGIQVVALEPLEMVQESRRPVPLEDFEAVAPEGSRALPPDRVGDLLSRDVQVTIERGPVVVIQ